MGGELPEPWECARVLRELGPLRMGSVGIPAGVSQWMSLYASERRDFMTAWGDGLVAATFEVLNSGPERVAGCLLDGARERARCPA